LILILGVVFTQSALLCLKAYAQQNPEPAAVTRLSGPAAITDDKRYRIGPGDVLTITVRKASELSGVVRVDQRGMIRIPMIEGEIRAACRTENELANEIATLYLEYKKNPSVEVFVTEFQSRPVSIIGAVNSPGQYRLQRQVKLLELLTFAGGPSAKAGRLVNVVHTGSTNTCEKTGTDEETVTVEGVTGYLLTEIIKGKEAANPLVRPGDVISIPEADQVFIIGHVLQPQAINLKDKTLTISRAIAMAGGLARDAKTSNIRIVRQIGDGEGKQEIFVDLKAIQKQKAVDIALLPDDIVEVPASAGKTILGIFTGALGPAISNGAVRAVPGVP
jgi:polysaccharide export outer membrane protein